MTASPPGNPCEQRSGPGFPDRALRGCQDESEGSSERTEAAGEAQRSLQRLPPRRPGPARAGPRGAAAERPGRARLHFPPEHRSPPGGGPGPALLAQAAGGGAGPGRKREELGDAMAAAVCPPPRRGPRFAARPPAPTSWLKAFTASMSALAAGGGGKAAGGAGGRRGRAGRCPQGAAMMAAAMAGLAGSARPGPTARRAGGVRRGARRDRPGLLPAHARGWAGAMAGPRDRSVPRARQRHVSASPAAAGGGQWRQRQCQSLSLCHCPRHCPSPQCGTAVPTRVAHSAVRPFRARRSCCGAAGLGGVRLSSAELVSSASLGLVRLGSSRLSGFG